MNEKEATHQLINETKDPDEINLLEYVYVLVKNKWIIFVVTLLGFFGGWYYAKKSKPTYIADAIIAPRETESASTPSISGFGMFNDIVASQLNIGGNASLDKINLIIDSRSFHQELVEKKNLYPLLYTESWDSVAQQWIAPFTKPTSIQAGSYIKSLVKTELKKNGVMQITLESRDSSLAFNLLTIYLQYLDDYIRNKAKTEAKENREYLEEQLITIGDPLIQSKIQELIAKEIEKTMVVSKEAFRILDPVLVTTTFAKNTMIPFVSAGALCLVTTFILVLFYALSASTRQPQDQIIIKNIKKELIRFPFQRT